MSEVTDSRSDRSSAPGLQIIHEPSDRLSVASLIGLHGVTPWDRYCAER